MMFKRILPIFLLLIFLSEIGLSNNDSLRNRKNLITVGTTGFYYNETGKYYILTGRNFLNLSINIYSFIRHISYERKISKNLSLKLSHQFYAQSSDNFVLREEKHNSYWEARDKCNCYSILKGSEVYSLGMKGIDGIDLSKNWTLNTSLGAHLQYNHQSIISVSAREGYFFFFDNPGYKLELSEDIIFRNRYVAGFNAGWNQFLKTKKEHSYPENYGFFSNAFYLGIKF